MALDAAAEVMNLWESLKTNPAGEGVGAYVTSTPALMPPSPMVPYSTPDSGGSSGGENPGTAARNPGSGERRFQIVNMEDLKASHETELAVWTDRHCSPLAPSSNLFRTLD
jgi:hypothetical protein